MLSDSLDNVFALTDEQEHALNVIIEFVKSKNGQEFRLGGYAGTGKTTVIKALQYELRHIGAFSVVSAFTGKAVNVLQRKGVSAQTLHSLMYDAQIDPEDGSVTFTRKSSLKSNPELVIVDEASMISTDL